MIRILVALIGIAGGAVLALGRMSAEQLHAVGANLLAFVLAYGLTALPWLLAALFAYLWRRADVHARAWRNASSYWLDEATRRPERKRGAR